MKVQCMIDSLGLEGYLNARTAHSKVHGIHVNHAWIWFFNARLEISINIFEDWHLNIHLFCSSLSNVLH